MEKKYGTWFSWDMSPRAQIFARNHSHVTDMTSMVSLMRWVATVIHHPFQTFDVGRIKFLI